MVSDKKFNIVMYGIAESPPGTSRANQQKCDLDALLQVLYVILALLFLYPVYKISIA